MDKELRISFLILGLITCLGVYCKYLDFLTTRRYCGPVVERFHTEAGYRVEPRAYVVIHSDSLHRNLIIKTSWTTYANAQVGKPACFDLQLSELSN